VSRRRATVAAANTVRVLEEIEGEEEAEVWVIVIE